MTSTVFVHTSSARKSKWSRYTLPFSVEAFAQLGDALYVRHGNSISVVSESAVTDEVDGAPVEFTGAVQWGWLDVGQPGVDKMLEGFDVVATGTPSVSIGYDQRNAAAFTTPYEVDPDTVPGNIIPLPVVAPSLAIKVDFAGGEAWSLSQINLYLHDERPTS
jgi:hypothetical protein